METKAFKLKFGLGFSSVRKREKAEHQHDRQRQRARWSRSLPVALVQTQHEGLRRCLCVPRPLRCCHRGLLCHWYPSHVGIVLGLVLLQLQVLQGRLPRLLFQQLLLLLRLHQLHLLWLHILFFILPLLPRRFLQNQLPTNWCKYATTQISPFPLQLSSSTVQLTPNPLCVCTYLIVIAIAIIPAIST